MVNEDCYRNTVKNPNSKEAGRGQVFRFNVVRALASLRRRAKRSRGLSDLL
jgi:hypothetical protein